MTKRQHKGFVGHGNGMHDSAVFKPDAKTQKFLDNVEDAMEKDRQKALANDRILVVDYYIEETSKIFIQACIFCPSIFLDGHISQQPMEKVKENHFKCPKCGFVKIKEGVEL